MVDGGGTRRRPTLVDVARRAEVSRATASLVLRGEGRISGSTRDRVISAMDELGYVYNRGAAFLRTRSSTAVGVLVSTVTNPFFAEVIVGLEERLAELGYVTLLANTLNDVERQEQLVTFLLENNVAGVVVVPAFGTPDTALDALTAAVPVLHLTRSVGDPPLYVGTDDVTGGRLAAEHLLWHGCRRIAYVGGPGFATARRDRLAGARQAVGDGAAATATIVDVPAETTGAGGLEAGRRALRGFPDIDAVLCHSDAVALGVLRAIREAGRTGEVAAVSFDGIESSALSEPPLTTVTCGPRELGRQAATMLYRTLDTVAEEAGGEGQTPGATVSLLEPTLVVRQSCGCP